MKTSNERIAYLDCFAGISGDMTLSALIDAGADIEFIRNSIKSIVNEDVKIRTLRVKKKSVSASLLSIEVENGSLSPSRNYQDIIKMIQDSGMKQEVIEKSIEIFTTIGKAEAKIHQIPLEKVHFHEVGALDSIIDIVGVSLAFHSLNIDKIYCSPIPLGSGIVHCEHGELPVPAPATLEMLKGVPLAECNIPFELTTPTGAGIAVALTNEFVDGIPEMKVESIGYGAGTYDFEQRPNVLRIIIGTK